MNGELPWPFAVETIAEGQQEVEGRDAAVAGAHGRWIKGAGAYRAYQAGHIVTLVAEGTLPNTNMRAELVQTQLTVFPPQFALLFFVPEVVMPQPRPFERHSSFMAEETIETVVVFDASGRHEIGVVQLDKAEASEAA